MPALPDDLPIDHMLTQPLLTEEGFVNEACMNELATAIANTPKVHDRCANDPEWNIKRWMFPKDITAAFAKWAVRQSPYPCPDNLGSVVGYLDACLHTAVKWNTAGMAELTLREVSQHLYAILYEQGVAYVDAWNRSKREPTDDERFLDSRPPDTDFIDLDALLTNVCIDLRTDQREHDRFDRDFERVHGPLTVPEHLREQRP